MPKVVVLGGGVAGLSAAHELVSRGFEVEVYERNPLYWGGKARSIDYIHEGQYTKPLPGEHGFRFFPGFYKHITDTMQHIPYPKAQGRGGTVFDNLVSTSRIMVARYDGNPIVTTASFPRSIKDLALIIHDMFGVDTGLSKEEEEFFAERTWQLMTSCRERIDNDYERLSWWQYTEAERFSVAYQHLLVEGLTRTLVAARAETASTKTGGDIFLQLMFCMTDPSVNTDRILDGPTNERWLHAWITHLRAKGVQLTQGVNVVKVNLGSDGSITSATIARADGSQFEAQGDYYIMAMPVERAAPLISDAMVAQDQRLQFIRDLSPSVSWMNGAQFYLSQDVPINKGHIICCDSQWALTCISQIQFWQDYDISQKGNGQVRGLLSVDISDWFTPGVYTTTKCAHECTRDEVIREVWAQLKQSLNHPKELLRDEMVVDVYLDRDIHQQSSAQLLAAHSGLANREPLLVNQVNTWGLRPNADCSIANLFFASDYVRTNTDLATMEGANEAARRAVNCILDKSGSRAASCRIWPLHIPYFLKPLRCYDAKRYAKGLPWSLHAPWYLELATVVLGLVYLVSALIKSWGKKLFHIGT